MLVWDIIKLIDQENWPLQPFCFAVILKLYSCRFTCQKMVRFDRIDFFLFPFKVYNYKTDVRKMLILGNFWHILTLGWLVKEPAEFFDFGVMLKVIS